MVSAISKPASAVERDQIFYTLEDSSRFVRVEVDRQRLLDGAKILAIKNGKSEGDFESSSFRDIWRNWHYHEDRLDCAIDVHYLTKYLPAGHLFEEKLRITRTSGKSEIKIEATRSTLGIWDYEITSFAGELLREEVAEPS